MENAAKALEMAAGILISILILGLVVYAYRNLSETKRIQQDVLKSEQSADFNRSFEGYNKESLLGSELISLANKIYDYDSRYDTADGYSEITLKITNVTSAQFPTYYVISSSGADHCSNSNFLSNAHKKLIDEIDTKGQIVKVTITPPTPPGGPAINYTAKELYIMYKKTSDKTKLKAILGVADEVDVKTTIEGYEYTKLVNEQEDFARQSFKQTNWKYDKYGRISEIEYKVE